MPGNRKRLAKLTKPRLHAPLPRERLFVRLDRARVERRAICVVGPPGAGKTTLVASWLERRRIGGIWYQVDPGDGDIATFFHYLALAAPGRPALPALTPEYLHDVADFGRRFFRSLFQRLPANAVLVLDNYQEVPAGNRFHALVAEAVSELPSGASLLCISRRDPPDCYARLIASQDVAFFDWEDLKLVPEEARALVSARGLPREVADDLHRQCEGWAAGLVLLIEERSRATGATSAGGAHPALFGYFAAQIFERLPADVQGVLMATAGLEWMDAMLATRLSGVPHARDILEDLCERRLFTYRHGDPPSFQYHALFKAFLRERAQRHLGADARRSLCRTAARQLERAGVADEALHLFAEAQDWDGAARVVLQAAAQMLAHGRFHTLAEWIGRLPAPARAAQPWLSYWLGRARVPFDAGDGRAHLEVAYAGFAQRGDVAGQVASAASVIDSIYLENHQATAMDAWIDVLARQLPHIDALDVVAMRLQVLSSLLVALLYRQPASAAIAPCLERLFALLEHEVDPDSRVSASLSLLTYSAVTGDFTVRRRVQACVGGLVARAEVAPARRLVWHLWLGYALMMEGEYAEAGQSFHTADALNEDNRFPWRADLMFCKALCIIGGDDPRRAVPLLEAMEGLVNAGRPKELGYLHIARAWHAMIRGDTDGAWREAEAALAVAARMGNFYLGVIWQAPRIWALAHVATPDAFRAHMDEALACVAGSCYRRPHVEWMTMQAWHLLRQGDREAARSALARALATARAWHHGAFFHRLCRFIPQLRDFAVSSGLEEQFVQSLVRRYRWPAPAPDVDPWPWPVRIYTLGRFEIHVHGERLTFGHKTPRKPIALLKAIVAFGSRRVPESRLVDAIWEDAAGDRGAHACSLALHRLRRLLGDTRLVTLDQGTVSLDPESVWTDVAAFDALTLRAGTASADRLLELYRGHFLADDPDQAWAVSMRERLRTRFLDSIEACARTHEQSGAPDAAVDLYLRGLEADPLAESFYRGLMRCYRAQGRRAEALSTYQRVRQLLSAVLGIAPSSETEALARQLRG